MRQRVANIEESLPICRSEEIPSSESHEPTDVEINRAYNIFDAEKMKYFKNVFVRLNRDFSSRKKAKPEEWSNFSEVIKICNANGFNLQCYLKYCFLKRLVPKGRGRSLSDISYLKNVPQILDYAKNRREIERLYKIYRSIQATIILIRKTSKQRSENAKTSIKRLISSDSLSTYITSGAVSPYFLALIPNVSRLIIGKIDKQCEDGVTLLDFCNRSQIYAKNAISALSMFYPNSMAKSIVELCS